MINELFTFELLTIIILCVFLAISVYYNFSFFMKIKKRDDGDAALIKNAYYNELTNLPNSNNMEIVLNEQIERSKRHEKPFLISTVYVKTNDKEKIVELGNLLFSTLREEDILGHIEDELFLIVFNEYLEEENFKFLLKRLERKIRKEKNFDIIIGKSKYPDDSLTISGLINQAKIKIQ